MDRERPRKTICDIKCQYVANLRKNHKLKLPPGRPTRALYLKMFQELMMPVVDLSKVVLDTNEVATLSPKRNDELVTHSACTTVPYQRVAQTTPPISVPPLISVHIKSAVPLEYHSLNDRHTSPNTKVKSANLFRVGNGLKMDERSYHNKEENVPYLAGASNLKNSVDTRILAISDNRTVFGVAEPARHTQKSGVKNVLISHDVTSVTAPRCRKNLVTAKRLQNSNKKTGRTGQAYAKIYKFLKSMPHKHLQGKLPPPSKLKGSHVSAPKQDGNVAQVSGHTIRKQLKLQASSQCIEKLSTQMSPSQTCQKRRKCIEDTEETDTSTTPKKIVKQNPSPLPLPDVNRDKIDQSTDHVCEPIIEDDRFNHLNPLLDTKQASSLGSRLYSASLTRTAISCDAEVPTTYGVFRQGDVSQNIPMLNPSTGVFEESKPALSGTTEQDTLLRDYSAHVSPLSQTTRKQNEELNITVGCIEPDEHSKPENRSINEMENDNDHPDVLMAEKIHISSNDTSSQSTETNSHLESTDARESRPSEIDEKYEPSLCHADGEISTVDTKSVPVKSENTPEDDQCTDNAILNVQTNDSMALSPLSDGAQSTYDSKVTISTLSTDMNIMHPYTAGNCITDSSDYSTKQTRFSDDTCDHVDINTATTHGIDQGTLPPLTDIIPDESTPTISAPMLPEQKSRPEIVVRRTALEVARDIVSKHIPSPKIADSNSPIKKNVLHSDKIDVHSSIAKALRVARQRIVDNSSSPQHRLEKNCMTEMNMDVRAVMESMLESLEESGFTALVPPVMEVVESTTSSNQDEENQDLIIHQIVEKLVADTDAAYSLNNKSTRHPDDGAECTACDDDGDVNSGYNTLGTDQTIVPKAITLGDATFRTIEYEIFGNGFETPMDACDSPLTQSSPADLAYSNCDSRSDSECHDCLHIDESYQTTKQPNNKRTDSYKGTLLQTCRGSKRTFIRRRQKKRAKFKLTMPAKRRTASTSNDERKVPKLRLVSTDSNKSKDALESRRSANNGTKSFVIKPLPPQKATKRKRTIQTIKENQDDAKTKQRKNISKNDLPVDDASRKLYPRRDTIVYTSDIPEIPNMPVPDTLHAIKPRRNKRKKSLATESNDPVSPNTTQTTGSADIEHTFTDDRLSMEFSKHNWILEKYKNELQSPEVQASPGGILLPGPNFPTATTREKPKKVRKQSNKAQKDSNKERKRAHANKRRRKMKLKSKAALIFEIPEHTNNDSTPLTSDTPVAVVEGNTQDEEHSGDLKILEVVSLAGFIQEEKEISSDSDHTDDVGRLAICEEQDDLHSDEPSTDIIKKDSDEGFLAGETDVHDGISSYHKVEATVQDLSIKAEKHDDESLEPLDLSMKAMPVLDLSKKEKNTPTTEATYNCFNIKTLDTTKQSTNVVSESDAQVPPKICLPMCLSAPPSHTQMPPKVSVPMCLSAPPIPTSNIVVKIEQSTDNPRSQSAHAFQTKPEPGDASPVAKPERFSDVARTNSVTLSNNVYLNTPNEPSAKTPYVGGNTRATIVPSGSRSHTMHRGRDQLLNDADATSRSEIAARNVTPPDKIISHSASQSHMETNIVPLQKMPSAFVQASPIMANPQNVTQSSTNTHIPPMRPSTLLPVYQATTGLVRPPVQERNPAPAFLVSNGMHTRGPVPTVSVPMQRLSTNVFAPTTAAFIHTSNMLRGHERYIRSNESGDHVQQIQVSSHPSVSTTTVSKDQMSRGSASHVMAPSTYSSPVAPIPRANMVPYRMGAIAHPVGCQPSIASLQGNTRFPGMGMERASFLPAPQNVNPRSSFQAPNMTVVPAGRNVASMPNHAMVGSVQPGRSQDRGSFQTSSKFSSGKRTEHHTTTEERISHILNAAHSHAPAPKHGMSGVTYASRSRHAPNVPKISEKTIQKTHAYGRGSDDRAVSVKTKEGTVTMPLGHINCEGCSKRANFLCSGCKRVAYCSPECQFFSWKTHKNQCG